MNAAHQILTGQRSSLLASFTTLLKMIAPLALAFLFTGCTRHAADMTGTWYRVEHVQGVGEAVTEVTFAKDGTFRGNIDIRGNRTFSFAGNWEIRDNWVHYSYTESNYPPDPVGKTDKDRLIEVTATTLKLGSPEGEQVFDRKK